MRCLGVAVEHGTFQKELNLFEIVCYSKARGGGVSSSMRTSLTCSIHLIKFLSD